MNRQGFSNLLARANRVVLLALAIVVLLAVYWVARTSRPAPVEPSSEALQPARLSIPEMGASADGLMVNQPLFWPSRRPYTPPELETEAPVQSFEQGSILDNMKVTGLVGGGDSALVIVQLGNQRRRIQLNESVQGWELVSISASQATFRGRAGDGALEERTLPLERVAVPSEAASSVRARFAPAASESSGTNMEAAEDIEAIEQPPASSESGEPVE